MRKSSETRPEPSLAELQEQERAVFERITALDAKKNRGEEWNRLNLEHDELTAKIEVRTKSRHEEQHDQASV